VRTALSLASGEPLTIVAIGSSSTAGAGASSPAASYPAQLEAELKARYPGVPITVLNRGVNGEDARQMLARFEETVLAEKPDLVLWQVGTNAVLRDQALTGEAPLIREGVRRLKAAQADVVLIDAQYAPKVIAKPDAAGMVALLGATARDEKVGVFHRFAIMQHWSTVDGVGFDQLLSPDGLHMNDWSYGCVAKLLAGSIAEAARTTPVAGGLPRRQ
jgi:lysophospholipase L1-like esterase